MNSFKYSQEHVTINQRDHFVRTCTPPLPSDLYLNYFDDIAKILIVNSQLHDCLLWESITWKDEPEQPVGWDEEYDREKLIRLVESTKTLPTVENYAREDWFFCSELICHVLHKMLEQAFKERVFFAHLTQFDDHFIWNDTGETLTWSRSDIMKLTRGFQNFHSELFQEWKNRTGRFAPVDPVLAEKMNHSEIAKELYTTRSVVKQLYQT